MISKSTTTIRHLSILATKLNHKLVKTKEYFFTKHFLATNIAISTVFSGFGDVIEQYIERMFLFSKSDKWDVVRSLKLSATGFPIGYISHYWYLYLDKRYTTKTHSSVMKKIVLSQIVYAPVCIVVFFVVLGCLDRHSRNQVLLNIETKGRRLYIVDWIFWPPVSLVNFYLVPLKYRLLYENIVSIAFDTFNSYVYHNHPVQSD